MKEMASAERTRRLERLARTHPRLKQRGERPAHLPDFLAERAWGPAGATHRAEYGQKAEASASPGRSDIATGEPRHATHEVE